MEEFVHPEGVIDLLIGQDYAKWFPTITGRSKEDKDDLYFLKTCLLPRGIIYGEAAVGLREERRDSCMRASREQVPAASQTEMSKASREARLWRRICLLSSEAPSAAAPMRLQARMFLIISSRTGGVEEATKGAEEEVPEQFRGQEWDCKRVRAAARAAAEAKHEQDVHPGEHSSRERLPGQKAGGKE
jgi:hypothetical protein